MPKILDKTKEWVLNLLLPKSCVSCGKEGRYVCEKCEIFLSEVENNTLGLVSVWEYEGLMEKLIWEIKYHGKYHIIDELVEKAFQKIELNLPKDACITYVPMYKKREKERGFNQSESIAKKIGETAKKEAVPLLTKIKDNRSQVGLSPQEREENVKGVFEFRGSFVPENVLLVDDVYTTGATVKECVRVLRAAGVKNVWVFTLARKLHL